MNIITQNPFRVLGLTGNSTERELQKQIGIIKRYAEIGKSKTFDYDFEFMGDFTRTLEDIQQAASRIEQAHKKLHYSLFWFVKNNQFDEIALNNLKDQNIEKVIEIWEKTLKEEISNKNYSSYLNLSTLYIALSSIDGQLDTQKLQKGITLKGKLINSDKIKDFSKLVTGNGHAIDASDISKKFVVEIIELLKPYIDKKNGISRNELISLFDSYPKNIQKYLSGKFTEVPISNIENRIEKTIIDRKANPTDADGFGEELYKTTKTDISLLKKLLGGDNVQFQMIANKLADEILRCSIDYFNEFEDEGGEFEPGDDALRIAKYAKSVGASGHTENRIDAGICTLRKIKFQDCYRAINVLEAINNAFIKLEEENRFKDFFERQIIDEDKVLQFLRAELSDRLIIKIAKSNNPELIVDFHKTLLKVIGKTSNSHFLKSLNSVFITSLPANAPIRVKFEEEKEKKRIINEINNLKSELSSLRKKYFYDSEFKILEREMASIKQWQLFRAKETKENKIAEQQSKMIRLATKGEEEKEKEISQLEEQLVIKRRELKGITQK